jgi:hypothetical protein
MATIDSCLHFQFGLCTNIHKMKSDDNKKDKKDQIARVRVSQMRSNYKYNKKQKIIKQDLSLELGL